MEEGAGEGEATGAPEGAEEVKQGEGTISDAGSNAEGEFIKATRSNASSMDRLDMGSRAITQRDEDVVPSDADIFDEFLAQVSFKRTTEIDGYSSTKIQFTFIPMKLTDVF